jgi:hypothetical protein
MAAAWEGDVETGVEVAMSSLCAIGFERGDAERLLDRLPAVVADAAGAFGLVMETPAQLETLRRDATRALVEINEGYMHTVRRLEALLAERDSLAAELGRANAELADVRPSKLPS